MSRDVDERIVQMEFDNKAFERDVHTTMSTLDKLKEALKFDKVQDTFSKISKSANNMDFKGAEEGVSSLEKRFSTLGIVGMTAIQNLTNTVMDFGKRVVSKTFGQIVSGGINRALNIEQAKFTIEGLGKDFVQLKEDINYAVSGTAYGFDEAAKAASMMAATGIEAGDEMKAALRGISGMAAMTGDSYANIADIFGNIAGKGKLGLAEVNRFATRGINIAAALAEQMHTTEGVIREMIHNGEIDFRTFSKYMDDAFGAHATEANKTFTGIMTNIKATLSRIGESFVHPLIETNEKDVLLLNAKTYKDVDKAVVQLADHVNRAYEGGVTARTNLNKALRESNKLQNYSSEQLKALIDGNTKAFIKASKDIPELSNLSKDELKSIFNQSEAEVEKVLSKSKDYANMTREELQDILATGKEQFIAQAREMDKYAGMSDKELGKLYERVSGFQYNLVTVFQAFRRVLQSIESAINNSSFLAIFIERFREASEVMSLFFNAVAASFSGGVLTISEQVKKIGKDGKEITKTLTHTIKATKLWNNFRKAIGLTEVDFTNLKDTFEGIISVFKLFGDAISSIFHITLSGSGILRPILSLILAITGTIGRLTKGLVDVIRSFNIFKNVAKVITTVLGGAIFAVTQVINVLVAVFTKITDNPIFKEIVRSLTSIGNAFNRFFGILLKVGKMIVNAFLLPFKQLAPVTEVVGNVIDSVLVKIAEGLKIFNDWLEKSVDAISDFLYEFIDFGQIYDLGKRIADLFSSGLNLEGFFESIGKAFGSLKGASFDPTKIFDSLANGVKTLFDFLTGIASKIDFKQIAKFLQDGLMIIAGILIISAEQIAKGLDALIKVIETIDVVKLATAFAEAIRKFVQLMVESILIIPNILGEALDQLVNTIFTNLNADAIGIALGKVLTNGIRLIFKAIPVILRIIVKALQEVWMSMPGILQEFAYEIEQVFGTTFTGMFKKIKSMLGNITFLDILKGLNFVALYQLLKEAARTLKSFRTLISPLEEVQKFMTSVRGVLNQSRKNLNAVYIRMMLVNLLLLLGGLLILSFIPFDRIINGLYKMTIIAGAFLLFMKGLGKVTKIDSPNVSKTIFSISSFIVALTLLAGMTALLAQVKNMGNGIVALIGILSSIGVFIVAIDKLKVNPRTFKTIAKAMKDFSAAMLVMSIGFAILSVLDPLKLLTSVLAIGSIIAVLTIASQQAKGANLKALAAVGPALLMMAAGLAVLSMFDFKSVATSVGAMVITLFALVGAAAIVSKVHLDIALGAIALAFGAFGVAALGFGAAVYLVVAALHTLGMMGQSGEIDSLKYAISSLADLMPQIIGKIGEGFVMAAAAIGEGAKTIIDAILNIIQMLLERTLERAQTFATLGVKIIVTLLDGILSGIGQVTTTAIRIVTTFLDGVASNMDSIVNSGLNIAIAFINGLANGIDTHGDEFRAAVANLIGSIVNFVIDSFQALLKKLPGGAEIAKKLDPAKKAVKNFFGDGKVNKETEQGAKKMADSVEKGSKKAGQSAKKNLAKIPESAKKAAKDSSKSFEGIDKKIGDPFSNVAKISDISKDMSKNATKSGNAYKNGIKGTKGLKEAGAHLGKEVSGGAGSNSIISALRSGGNSVGQGYVNGIEAKWDDAYRAGYTLGKKAKQGEKDATKHSSPSKEFYKAGRFIGEGYVNGISSFFSKVYQTGNTLGLESIEGVSGAINKITDMVQEGIDSTPTIRPVLDLSNVKMGVNSMHNMFDSSQYAIRMAGGINPYGMAGFYNANRTMNITNNITVDGAENPSEWADEFVHELEIQARTE